MKVVNGDFGKSIGDEAFDFFDEILSVRLDCELDCELWLDLRRKIFKGDIALGEWLFGSDSVHSEDESKIKGILKIRFVVSFVESSDNGGRYVIGCKV